jgi:integrase
MARKPTGITTRHSRACCSRDGTGCNCDPSYEGWVWLPREQKKVRKSFPTMAAAKAWRTDALHALRLGRLKAPTRKTLNEEAADWLRRADDGEALTRSGGRYKPSLVRLVESDFRLHISPELGARRLSELTRHDVQQLVDRLRTRGLSGSKVRGVVTSLKIVLRRPLEDDELSTNPAERLRLPAGAGSRKPEATADEVQRLLDALPADLKPLYATAAYSGLRRGELRGLRWEDVDLASGVLHVVRSWDDRRGAIPPKSTAGTREVPVPPLLRDYLAAWKMESGREGQDLVFGTDAARPFSPSNVRNRAMKAWQRADAVEADRAVTEGREARPLVRLGLHELRHVWVSLLHDAGFSLEMIGKFAGHSSAWMTERYSHLLPGAAVAAGERFGEYLERANTLRRLEQLSGDVAPAADMATGAHTGAQQPEPASLSRTS